MADDFGMGYALGADSGNRNNNDMFGCGGSWWIVIILFALILATTGATTATTGPVWRCRISAESTRGRQSTTAL